MSSSDVITRSEFDELKMLVMTMAQEVLALVKHIPTPLLDMRSTSQTPHNTTFTRNNVSVEVLHRQGKEIVDSSFEEEWELSDYGEAHWGEPLPRFTRQDFRNTRGDYRDYGGYRPNCWEDCGYRRDSRDWNRYDDRDNHHEGRGGYGEYKLHMDLPAFNGQMHIEEFLDWVAEVERFFDYMNVPDHCKVKLVVLRLKATTFAWWEQIVATRAIQQRRPIRTWTKMKQLLRSRFLPKDYQRTLFGQL